MADPIRFMLTIAGIDALINAQSGATEPVRIVSLGLTEQAFVMAPTITALPGEHKRITTISGETVDETVIHMTAQDLSEDIYDLCGLGLYLEDGTLFAVYSQPTPLFRKVSIAFFLLALDITFSSDVAGDIVFGDTTFLMPPATRTVRGVARLATPEMADEGADDETIITPLLLEQRLGALAQLIDTDVDGLGQALAALLARTVTGGGLVTGGGNLSASRVLTVLAASAADVAAATATDRAITPAALSGLARDIAANGYATLPGTGGLILQWGQASALPNTTTNILFPIAFPTGTLAVVTNGGTAGGPDSQDNPPVLIVSGITLSGFAVFSADDTAGMQSFMALGY
ncbi:MAG: hypothetical protein AB7E60_11070 [Sphingobium sp.]